MTKQELASSVEEPAAESMAKQARDVLLMMGLPSESVEQAVKKIHDFAGDLDALASYALSLSIPQAECIEEHLSDDMISSDEDAGDDSKEKWNQPPPRVQSPKPPSPIAQAPAEVWVDPICKIFQNSDGGTLAAEEELALVPFVPTAAAAAAAEAGSSQKFSMDRLIKTELQPMSPPKPPPREYMFVEMGFPLALVRSAMDQLQQHGSDVEDSVLLQFLFDHKDRGENSAAARRVQPAAESEESDPDEDMVNSVLRTIEARSLKSAAVKSVPEESESDSDAEDEAARVRLEVAQCKSGAVSPSGSPSLESFGFSPALIARAVEELGRTAEHDMLLEYLLYLSASQDPEASSSARGEEDSTLEILTKQFQFPAVAVEKAMHSCNTPLYRASQEEMGVLIDFLGAHMENLIQEDGFGGDYNLPLPDSDSDDGDSDSEDGSLDFGDNAFMRETSPPWGKGVVSKGSGKRKIDERGKMVAHSGRFGYSKGAFSGIRTKKPTPSVPKFKVPSPIDLRDINKQRGSIGFGLPGQPIVKHRQLKEDIKGAPFFYFENVAGMPVGEWKRIETHLFGIEAEFVDAMHFSACRRSRGYIHNLPIEGRKKLIKDPPMTIMELMPQTKPFWPEWDRRTKLNCINTVRASEFTAKRLGIKDGTGSQGPLNLTVEEQKNYMYWCCKLNLVWTSPNVPSPVEADEIEAMLGFDKDHTRSCYGHTARYKALGNSFSVFTVAYHFSVLKPLYPKGIKVLSLFSGIGGAEVALHKCGIKLNVVVSVELEEGARRCLQTWWALTKQTGVLDVTYHDVRHLTREVLCELVNKYRGFDLIVGGSPCNNLTGNNRHTRTGLEGEHSTMFFEFSRIVSSVRELTIRLPEHRR